MNCSCKSLILFFLNFTAFYFTLNLYSDVTEVRRINNREIAVVIVAYNRPEYFKQLISSIENNAESQTIPFYFFLDGGINSTQKENENIIKNSSIKNKKIILRSSNYGCGRNLIDARRQVFDIYKYKKLIFLEEDSIITPTYFKFLLNLYTWTNNKYDNIGLVSGWSKCLLDKNEKSIKQNEITVSLAQHGYMIDRKTWNKIKSIIYYYEHTFLKGLDYKTRNSCQIRNWFKKILLNRKANNTLNSVFINQHYFDVFSDSKVPTSQDAVTMLSLFANGLVPIATTVNRLVVIGQKGLNFTPALYNKLKFNEVKLDTLENDENIKEFKLQLV